MIKRYDFMIHKKQFKFTIAESIEGDYCKYEDVEKLANKMKCCGNCKYYEVNKAGFGGGLFVICNHNKANMFDKDLFGECKYWEVQE